MDKCRLEKLLRRNVYYIPRDIRPLFRYARFSYRARSLTGAQGYRLVLVGDRVELMRD